MTESQSGEPSTFSKTTAAVRDAAHEIRNALDNGQPHGQWKVILRNAVREAPLPALAVAFVLGVLVARR
ncbi:hypothetical protein FBZ96_10260 [Bradyrhizobium stylosanthis]|uniref:DUF3618 domain-containing protein n=1 Tax=Bradyrhizobium stylosanthis TaxID=1803665 RepID=A0A560E2I5_9BRAD|nr:hypothetical protein FBZ96_10260 [Bradyrhizobium stylosanthis]